MKICSLCKKEKEDDEFNKNGTKLQCRCRACNSDYLKEHYKNNKGMYKNNRKIRKSRTRLWYIDFKNDLQCERCSETHIACLEFHHKDDDKLFNISTSAGQGFSKKKILEEMEKCNILCSNCHRKLHYEERLLGIGEVA